MTDRVALEVAADVAVHAVRIRPCPTVAVVICAYTEQRWDDLVASVASVRAQTLSPAELVVVIDHSPALLARARAEFADARVVANLETKGLSGARNTGILGTDADVVAFIDDDAVADPRWLEHLVSAYRDPLVLGVGGSAEPRWDERRPAWFPDEFDWVIGCSYRGQPQRTSIVRNVIGCNMSFRREVFDEIGGFRHELGRVGAVPTGCEETELCIRASQYFPSGRIILEPAAVVVHRVRRERATWQYFCSRCQAEGRSKAALCDLVGGGAGLSSERRYATRVLPAGVIRGLFGRRADGGREQALAILGGFVFVASGYAKGRWTSIRDGRDV